MITSVLPISGAHLLCEEVKYLSFCSHDYLCLSEHSDIKKGAIKFLLEHGLSSAGDSPLMVPSYQEPVMDKLSGLLQRETALFFSSHFEAQHAVLRAFEAQGMQIFSGEISRLDLERNAGPKLIAAESEQADLSELIQLAREFDALLLIDDSHSFGVKGPEGLGFSASYPEIDLIIGTFSKSCGSFGGFIATSQTLRDRILRHTPIAPCLSPPLVGAVDAALDLIPVMEGERRQLHQLSHQLRQKLKEMRFELASGTGPLISLLLSSNEEAEHLKALLHDVQILVSPPCGPRLQLALTLAHTPEHLSQLQEALSHAVAHRSAR